MDIRSFTISLTVRDPAASSAWMQRHLGFEEALHDDGFAYLRRSGAPDLALMRTDSPVLPAHLRDRPVDGVILALVVPSLDAVARRLAEQGIEPTLPIREEPWGERLFQVTDPCGVVVQLVEWRDDATAPQAV